jgi:hypothetical protein
MSRPLTETEATLIERVIDQLPQPARSGLRAQIRVTQVVTGSPTFPHFDVGAAARVLDVPDGPLPVRTSVIGDDGQFDGELLVWVEAGLLSALEYAWVTDQPPAALPQPSRLAFDEPE